MQSTTEYLLIKEILFFSYLIQHYYFAVGAFYLDE